MKPIPTALAAVGILSSIGVGEMVFAAPNETTPAPGVYSIGTFGSSSVAVVARGISVPSAGTSTLTTGAIIMIFKQNQTSWVYAATGSGFDYSVNNASRTLTASQTFSSGSGTSAVNCSIEYAADYDNVVQIMGISFGNLRATTSAGASATSTGTQGCKSAFNTLSGIPTVAIGSATKQTFRLIY